MEIQDKIYDYIAAGLPVNNSLRGEVRDVIREKRIGLQYNAKYPSDLLPALEKQLKDDALRGEIGRNLYDDGILYDRHVQYAKMVEIVDTVCSGRKASAAAAR